MGKAEWALGAMLLSAVIAALVASHTNGEPDNLLFHYQGLFAGLLALGSALLATFFLHRQIRQERDLENARKSGQREAARSWLSLQASTILAYAEATGEQLWRLYETNPEAEPLKPAAIPEFPTSPMSAAAAVKEFAQFASKDEARFIALIFASMQLLETNIRSLKSSKVSHYRSNLESYVIYAAELYARTEALLDYARHVTDVFPTDAEWKRFSGAVFFMTLSHEPTDLIKAYIAKGSGGNLASYLPNRFEKNR